MHTNGNMQEERKKINKIGGKEFEETKNFRKVYFRTLQLNLNLIKWNNAVPIEEEFPAPDKGIKY